MTGGKRTLLLVEDDALIAMHQKTLLEKHGFEVATAMRPEQAVSKVADSNADLILMDIDLGFSETDGTRLAERILERRDIPIVFLTSHAEKEYVDRARSITRYGYVLKNFGEFCLSCPVRNTVLDTLASGHGADRVEAELPDLQDGQRRFACYSLSTAYLEIRGEPFVVVSLEDITELKDTERALEESRSEYEECYRDLPVMLHSLDAAARILDVNSEWLLTLGYAREEVVGRKSVEFLTPESRRFAMQQALPEFFRKGRARDVPYRFRRKDGGPVDVLLSAMAQHDRRGAFVRSVVVSLKSANAAASRTQTVS